MDKKCKGLIMLVFGVLFLLGTLGVWPEFTFMKYWPVVLIVLGLHNLLCCCWRKSMCNDMKGGMYCDKKDDMACCDKGSCEATEMPKKKK